MFKAEAGPYARPNALARRECREERHAPPINKNVIRAKARITFSERSELEARTRMVARFARYHPGAS
jgi:hypothetical protein